MVSLFVTFSKHICLFNPHSAPAVTLSYLFFNQHFTQFILNSNNWLLRLTPVLSFFFITNVYM